MNAHLHLLFHSRLWSSHHELCRTLLIQSDQAVLPSVVSVNSSSNTSTLGIMDRIQYRAAFQTALPLCGRDFTLLYAPEHLHPWSCLQRGPYFRAPRLRCGTTLFHQFRIWLLPIVESAPACRTIHPERAPSTSGTIPGSDFIFQYFIPLRILCAEVSTYCLFIFIYSRDSQLAA